jgi:hypothetical protein
MGNCGAVVGVADGDDVAAIFCSLFSVVRLRGDIGGFCDDDPGNGLMSERLLVVCVALTDAAIGLDLEQMIAINPIRGRMVLNKNAILWAISMTVASIPCLGRGLMRLRVCVSQKVTTCDKQLFEIFPIKSLNTLCFLSHYSMYSKLKAK